MESKRTQADRTAASRAALLDSARGLFAERGYAGVGTEELARAAGLTRGALYHQFQGKEGLFEAVFEAEEAALVERLGARMADADPADPVALLRAGVDGWLEATADPGTARIVLLDAPAVLGWERWREIGRRYGVGLVEAALAGLVDAGTLPDQPVRPLAHVLSGALEEAGLYAARADDPVAAREEVRAALDQLLLGMLSQK